MSKQPEPIFVPAKPGEAPPKGVWVPNREERRKGKKNKTSITGMLTAKEALKNVEFKQQLYKDLLENLQKLEEREQKEMEKESNENFNSEN